jgi:hypothetical protein
MKKIASFSTPALHLTHNIFERWAVIKATGDNDGREDKLAEFEHDPDAASILMGNFDDPEKLRKRVFVYIFFHCLISSFCLLV